MAEFIVSAFMDEAASDLDGQIGAIKRHGLNYCDVRNIDGKCIIDYTDEQISEFKKRLDDEGIKVLAIGSPIGKCDVSAPIRLELERMERTVRCAKLLDAKCIRMFSFFVPENKADEYERTVMNGLEKIISIAERESVAVYHENEKGIYGDKIERVLKLIDRFGTRMGHIFDAPNYVHCGDDPYDNFMKIKDCVHYLHVKDAKLTSGAVMPAGYGDCKLHEILNTLKDGKALVYLSIEPHLAIFDGLQNLQTEGLVHEIRFASQAEAFDFSVTALKKLLYGLGLS